MVIENKDFLAQMFEENTFNSDEPNGIKPSELPDHDTEEKQDDVLEVHTQEITAEGDSDTDTDVEVPVGYVEFLKEYNLIEIPQDMEFTGKAEELEQIFKHTEKARKQQSIEQVFQTLPEDFKPLFDYALKGGSSLEDYLSVYGDNFLQQVDLDSPEDQKALLTKFYQETTNYNDEKISRLVSLVNDEDTLRLEAREAYEELVNIQKNKEQYLIQQAEQETQRRQQAIEAQTIALVKAVEETPLIHPQRKNKVKSFFFDPIKYGDSVTTGFNKTIQEILSNPEHQAQLADLLLEYDPKHGFVSDKLEKRKLTKDTKAFQALLHKTLDTKTPQKGTSNRTPNSNDVDWEKFL